MDSFVYDKMIGTSETATTGNASINAMGRRVPMLLKECPDARRVAPISACVSSSTKYYQQTLTLMGATRLASGHFPAAPQRVTPLVRAYF